MTNTGRRPGQPLPSWVSLIDLGFSQQSMFRYRHLCLNEAAPSIKAWGRGRSLPVGGCESMQQNWIFFFLDWWGPSAKMNETEREGVEKAIFFVCCRCFRFDSDGRCWHVRVRKKIRCLHKRMKEFWDNWRCKKGTFNQQKRGTEQQKTL